MPKQKIGKDNIYYELHGEGKPLVLVAGFSCDSTSWEPILNDLSSHYQVLIFDHRGIGKSDCLDEPFSKEMMANYTVELIKALHLDRPHLLGHSMGGAVAQMIAYQHKDMIDKLILANTLIKFNSISSFVQNFLQHLREDDSPRLRQLEGVIPWLFSEEFISDKEKMENFIQAQLSSPLPPSKIGLKRQLEALLQFDSSDWYSEIDKPTLIIHGENDILCPGDSILLAQGIRGSKLALFSQMGHMPLVERPKEFTETVLEFLKV